MCTRRTGLDLPTTTTLYVSGLSPSPATIPARQIFVDEIKGSFTEVLPRGLHKKNVVVLNKNRPSADAENSFTKLFAVSKETEEVFFQVRVKKQ
jgi:hypothetical protein